MITNWDAELVSLDSLSGVLLNFLVYCILICSICNIVLPVFLRYNTFLVFCDKRTYAIRYKYFISLFMIYIIIISKSIRLIGKLCHFLYRITMLIACLYIYRIYIIWEINNAFQNIRAHILICDKPPQRIWLIWLIISSFTPTPPKETNYLLPTK